MPAFAHVLACNTASFWWPRKLNGVQFTENGICSDMGLWRHITPTLKAMALRSSMPTIACRFGWTQLMPLVDSRKMYHCARKCMHNGHSRPPTGSSCYIFYPQNLLSASTMPCFEWIWPSRHSEPLILHTCSLTAGVPWKSARYS